jgi:MFS family permease
MSDAVGRRRPAVLGALLCAFGLLLLWSVAAGAMAIVLAAILALVGFGMGMAGSPRQTAALESIEPERVGMAAGTYLTGRYLGGALGATLAGAVLGGTVTAALTGNGFAVTDRHRLHRLPEPRVLDTRLGALTSSSRTERRYAWLKATQVRQIYRSVDVLYRAVFSLFAKTMRASADSGRTEPLSSGSAPYGRPPWPHHW